MTLFLAKYDSNEEMSLESIIGIGEYSERLKETYNNTAYKKAVKLWLPFLNKRGFLDGLMRHEDSKTIEGNSKK